MRKHTISLPCLQILVAIFALVFGTCASTQAQLAGASSQPLLLPCTACWVRPGQRVGCRPGGSTVFPRRPEPAQTPTILGSAYGATLNTALIIDRYSNRNGAWTAAPRRAAGPGCPKCRRDQERAHRSLYEPVFPPPTQAGFRFTNGAEVAPRTAATAHTRPGYGHGDGMALVSLRGESLTFFRRAWRQRPVPTTIHPRRQLRLV